jgi:hypothetical protein
VVSRLFEVVLLQKLGNQTAQVLQKADLLNPRSIAITFSHLGGSLSSALGSFLIRIRRSPGQSGVNQAGGDGILGRSALAILIAIASSVHAVV